MGVVSWLTFLSVAVCCARAGKTGNSTDCKSLCGTCEEYVHIKNCSLYCSAAPLRNTCYPPAKYSELVIGVSAGVILCFVIAMGGLLCVKLRKRKNRKERLPKHSAKELRKFHAELDRLRPHAYTFLAILNNVRRQVREMHRAGNTDAAVICGRSLGDLAKILMLLNRQDVPVIPPDWPRLSSWADRLLERTTLVNSQNQVGPLIQFLQTPTPKPRQFLDNNSTPMSTLKPPAYEDFIALQDQAPSEFPYGRTQWAEQWEFPAEAASQDTAQNDAWQSRHQVVQEHLWIDDDFFMMSFRPQDEIVTVL